jgi:SNF2 family DNA or RNA helicase
MPCRVVERLAPWGEAASSMQPSVIPLPHPHHAQNRAVGQDRIRYRLAGEADLGKTIEAGRMLRELKPRGRTSRILVVAPKGTVRQWQAEMGDAEASRNREGVA